MRLPRSQAIGLLIGAASLGTAYWMVGQQTREARVTALRVCLHQLANLCEDHTCANIKQNLDSIQAREGTALHAEHGRCGDLLYTEWHDAEQGELAFFDKQGDMVGARAWNQAPLFCDGTARWISYGTPHDCETKPLRVLFSTAGEAKPRLDWPSEPERVEVLPARGPSKAAQ